MSEEDPVIKLLPGVLDDPAEVVLFGGGEELAPLRLAHLAPAAAMPFHVFTVADGVPGEFVLTWRRGRALPKEAQEMVWGYFALAEAGEVLAYLESQLEAGKRLGEAGESLQLLTDTLLVLTQHVFCHDGARTPQNLARARSLIAVLARGLRHSEDILKTVSSLRRHDSGLFSHCLNVALLTLALAPALFPEEDVGATMALGALLHDLGMMPWARETFHQTSPLSDDDWENIRGHPDRGVELLTPLDELPEEALLMIRQHHEGANGSGYPQGLQGDGIHPWARFIKIVDSYEAMTSLRPWRPPISERQAMRIMASAWSAQGSYDPEYLKRFLAYCQREEGHRP